jgi:hypothetical protein
MRSDLACVREFPLPNPSPQGGGACLRQPLALDCSSVLPFFRSSVLPFPQLRAPRQLPARPPGYSGTWHAPVLPSLPADTNCLAKAVPRPIPPPCGEGAPKGRAGSLLRRTPHSPPWDFFHSWRPHSPSSRPPSRDPVTRCPSRGETPLRGVRGSIRLTDVRRLDPGSGGRGDGV